MIRMKTDMATSEKVLDQLKNPRRREAVHNKAVGQIASLTKRVRAISPTKIGMLVPLEKENGQEPSRRPSRVRRGKLRAHEGSAMDLTCSEADVDDLLSAGELT
jgi:hypothetical protein